MMILTGLKFTVESETQFNQKLLKGSKGVFGLPRGCFAVDELKQGQRINVLIYRVGKTGKFRLKPYVLNIPLFGPTNDEKIDEKLLFDAGINIDPTDNLMKYDENEFLAWFACKVHALVKLMRRTYSSNHGIRSMMSEYTERTPVWGRWDSEFVSVFNDLVEHTGGVIIKDNNPILHEVGAKKNRIQHVQFMRCLETLFAGPMLHQQVEYVTSCRTAIHVVMKHVINTLRREGCKEKDLIDFQKTKDVDKFVVPKKCESYKYIYKYMMELWRDIQGVQNRLMELQAIRTGGVV